MALNLNTELALIDTTANAGTIVLPATSSSPGRVVTFKDIVGKFGVNTLTLTTSGSDTFEDDSTQKILRESNGVIQLVASGSKWYILTGTIQNSITVSTLVTSNVSSISISTTNLLVSSLNTTIFQQSTLAYFNSNVFAGSRVYPATNLNNYRFSLSSLFSYLLLWVDSSDVSTITRTGSTITRIIDKSSNNNISISGTLTYTLGTQNGLNVISVTNNGTFVTVERPLLSPLNQVSAFVVLIQSVTPNGNFEFFRADSTNNFFPGGLFGFFDMFFTNGGGMNVNINASSLGYGPNITGAVNIYEIVYDGNRRTSYLTGLQLATGLSVGNFLTTSYSTLRLLSGITGYFCEAMYFQRALSNLERQQTEGYLAWKWGLQAQLPASHPFRNAPPS